MPSPTSLLLAPEAHQCTKLAQIHFGAAILPLEGTDGLVVDGNRARIWSGRCLG
jgi:hypothetical protein